MAGGRRVDDLRRGGRIAAAVTEAARTYQDSADQSIDAIFDDVESKFVDAWQADAGLMTYGEAVAELLEFRESEGEQLEMTAARWRQFAERAPMYTAREKARDVGAAV